MDARMARRNILLLEMNGRRIESGLVAVSDTIGCGDVCPIIMKQEFLGWYIFM